MKRRQRQWCYWASLGVFTLIFCIQWIRNSRSDPSNSSGTSTLHKRKVNLGNNDKYQDPKSILKLEAKEMKQKVSAVINRHKPSLNMQTNLQYRPRNSSTTKRPKPVGNLKSVELTRDLTNAGRRDTTLNAKYKPQKVVIVMTQNTDASSFIEKLALATKESMYLHEPLFPFGMNCTVLQEYKTDFLGQLLNCNFSNLQSQYRVGFNASNTYDNAKCVKNGLCFAGANLLREYASTCRRLMNEGPADGKFHPNSVTCGYPLKGNVLQEQCTKAKTIFTTNTGICSVDQLQKVYDFLIEKGKDPYVIHLVRDPRSTIFSQTKHSKSKSREYKAICGQIRRSLEAANRNVSDKVLKMVQDRRYMKIREEDLSLVTFDWAKKIFLFLGNDDVPMAFEKIAQEKLEPQSEDLDKRKKSNTSREDKHKKNEESTAITYSKGDLQKWRERIPVEMAIDAQSECSDVMKALGYISFNTEQELRNLSRSSFLFN